MRRKTIDTTLAIIAKLILLSAIALAANAQSGYNKAFDLCRQAGRQANSDPQAALSKFKQYEEQRDAAFKQDSSLKSSPEVLRDERLCADKKEKILWALVEPILDVGLKSCQTAKDALDNNDFVGSQLAIDSYMKQRDEALGLWSGATNKVTIKGKIKTCDRIPKKIAAAQSKADQEQQAITQLNAAASSYQSSCDAALAKRFDSSNALSQSLPDIERKSKALKDMIASWKYGQAALANAKSSQKNGDACLSQLYRQKSQLSQKALEEKFNPVLTSVIEASIRCQGLLQSPQPTQYEASTAIFEAEDALEDPDINASYRREISSKLNELQSCKEKLLSRMLEAAAAEVEEQEENEVVAPAATSKLEEATETSSTIETESPASDTNTEALTESPISDQDTLEQNPSSPAKCNKAFNQHLPECQKSDSASDELADADISEDEEELTVQERELPAKCRLRRNAHLEECQ